MSDWRSGNNNDRNGRKESRPKSKPVDPAPSKAIDSAPKSAGAAADWRGNAKKSSNANKPLDKAWTGRGPERTTSTGALRKAIMLGGLGLAITSMFYLYWVYVWIRDPKLPVVVSIAADYTTLDLGQNSFGTQAFDLKQEKLHLFPASQKVAVGDPFRLGAQESFLEEISTNEVWGQKWIGFQNYFQGTKLIGGGPSRSVTAYFVSCLIARKNVANSDDKSMASPWMLLAKDEDPFSVSSSDTEKLTIEKFLNRIASQTAKGKYAFVVMDVKPPTVVANLGDLEFPKRAFDEAFKGLPDELRDRLIVCLPCDEGEESWFAPEFSSSVFAHFFWRGVTTGLDNKKRKWSMLEFQNALSETVKNWVARYRYAKQVPTFLMSEMTKGKIKELLFVETSGGEFEKQAGINLKPTLKDRHNSLENLWKEYEALHHILYTNPLGFATMESGLIHMEDIAEYASESAWTIFSSRIKEHIEKLKLLSKFDRRVSLIEAKQHGDFFRDPSIFGNQADAKCLEVWSKLDAAAKSDDKEAWRNAFSKEGLRSVVDNCALDPQRTPFEWIEVRILKLMQEATADIDIAETEKANEAIAGLIRTYSILNGIAFEPRLELSKWTAKRSVAMDKRFVECFDHFFANDFGACKQKINAMEQELDSLSKDFKSLRDAMTTRDEILWCVPHLLATQMRMSRLPGAKEDESVAEIAALLKAAISIRDSLKDAQAKTDTLGLEPEAATKLESLKKRLMDIFAEVASKADDSGTLPMTKIALRWPLITTELRGNLHKRLVNLYNTKKDDSESLGDSKKDDGKWSSLTPSAVGGQFLRMQVFDGSNLETIGSYYERMVKDDPRYSIRDFKDRKDSNANLDTLRRVYQESYNTRIEAHSYGQRAPTKSPKEWPWNAPDQLHALNEVLYNNAQIERLCVTRWGDGDLNSPDMQDHARVRLLYFERMMAPQEGQASKSFNFSPKLALAKFTQSNPTSAELEVLSEDREVSNKQFLEKAVKEVTRLGVNVRPFNLAEKTVSMTFDPNDWNAFATMSISGDAGQTGRIPFTELGKKNCEGVDVNRESKKELVLDPKLAERQLLLRLGVRGHYRESPLSLADPINSFLVSQERQLEPATVTVNAKENESITMWILLDCSNSMVQDGIHNSAKSTVVRLMKQIKDLKNIRVGFIAFGRKPDSPAPEILTQSAIGNQIFKSAVKEGNGIDELIELIEPSNSWIRPSGCTPLYDAIYTACEEGTNNWIVVVSDGSNDLSPRPDEGEKRDDKKYYYPQKGKGDKRVEDVQKAVVNSNHKLFVFQYLNDTFYFNARFANDEVENGVIKEGGYRKGDLIFPTGKDGRNQKVEEIKKANEELKNMLYSLPLRNGENSKPQVFYNDFDSLEKKLIEMLPFSKVTVMDSNNVPLGEASFGKPIELKVSEPSQAKIIVNNNGQKSDASTIWLTGGEKLEFIYARNRLAMIPYKSDAIGLGKSFEAMNAERENNSMVAVRARRAITKPSHLDLKFALKGGEAETVEQKTFTRRPNFVVARIWPAGAEPNQAFWVCDHSFWPKTHYPVVQLPYIPWQENNNWRSRAIDIGVWMSDEVPKNASKVKLKPGDQINESKLQCVRTGNKITVTMSEGMDSHLVICTTATNTNREYSNGRETKIVFDVPSDGEAEICIINQSQLAEWASEGALPYYSVSDLKVLE